MSAVTPTEDAPRAGGSHRRRNPKPARAAVIAALALVAIAVVFVAFSWTHAPWRDFVRRRPASYVELTFVRPAALPSTTIPGQPTVFSFEINNAEKSGTERTVRWATAVRDTATGSTTTANTGSVVLAGGAAKTITEQVMVPGRNRSEIIVKLDSGQQIDFYVMPPSSG